MNTRSYTVILLALLMKSEAYWDNLSKLKCKQILTKADRLATTSQTSPNLRGIWVSERCEVRPGPGRPEYLVRRYHFYNSTHFLALQYYFSDPDCTQPFYALQAKGKVPWRYMTSSLLIDDAISLPRVHIHEVYVLPYTYPAARFLKSNTFSSIYDQVCSDLKKLSWLPGESYHIQSFYPRSNRQSRSRKKFINFDCTESLGFSLNELQLIRVQGYFNNCIELKMVTFQVAKYRSRISFRPSGRSLLLGDIPSNFAERMTYVPGTFQDPLYDVEKVNNCPGCQRIRHSNLLVPPIFQRPILLQHPPIGAWVSERCESLAQGTYLTRKLIFHRKNPGTWTIFYYSFHDSQCLRPFYAIEAGGQFTLRGPSSLNADSRDYDFLIKHLSITPQNQASLRLFSSYRGVGCGKGSDSWHIGRSQNVTDTHGCSLLALYVPETKLEIVKVIRGESGISRLYLGRSDITSQGGQGYSQNLNRPTAFYPPLIGCRIPAPKASTFQQNLSKENKQIQHPLNNKKPTIKIDQETVTKQKYNRSSQLNNSFISLSLIFLVHYCSITFKVFF